MMEFMKAGGAPIWIVLLFGLATLVIAAFFAWRPDERRYALLTGMTKCTQFALWSGILSCLAAVMIKVPNNPQWAKSPDLPLIVMTGIGESLTPGILGFTILSLAWLLGAFGKKRLAEKAP